jgi:hypothetical protein
MGGKKGKRVATPGILSRIKPRVVGTDYISGESSKRYSRQWCAALGKAQQSPLDLHDRSDFAVVLRLSEARVESLSGIGIGRNSRHVHSS